MIHRAQVLKRKGCYLNFWEILIVRCCIINEYRIINFACHFLLLPLSLLIFIPHFSSSVSSPATSNSPHLPSHPLHYHCYSHFHFSVCVFSPSILIACVSSPSKSTRISFIVTSGLPCPPSPAGIPSRMKRTCLWWWTCSWEETCATTCSRTSTSRRAPSNSTSVNWPWLLVTSALSASYTGETFSYLSLLIYKPCCYHAENLSETVFISQYIFPCYLFLVYPPSPSTENPSDFFLLRCPLPCYFIT